MENLTVRLRILAQNAERNLRYIRHHYRTVITLTIPPFFTVAGYYIDRWVKVRAENLAEIKDIRKEVQKQALENEHFIKQLPLYDSHLGFYLYNEPSAAKLQKFTEQHEALRKLSEHNQHLQQRITHLNLPRFHILPREDYRQSDLLKDELMHQSNQVKIANNISTAMYFYLQQQYGQASQQIKEGIAELSTSSPTTHGLDVNALLAVAYNLEARVQRITGNIPQAIQAYEKANEYSKTITRVDIRATILSQYALFLSEEAFHHTLPTRTKELSYPDPMTLHRQAYLLHPFSAMIVANYARGLHLEVAHEKDLMKQQKAKEKSLYLLNKAMQLESKNTTYRLYRGIVAMELAMLHADKNKQKKLEEQALQDFSQGLNHHSMHSSLLCRSAILHAKHAKAEKGWWTWHPSSQTVALKQLDHLKETIQLKEDWLENAEHKIDTIKKLQQNVNTLESFDYHAAIQDCRNIARFFYRKDKLSNTNLQQGALANTKKM